MAASQTPDYYSVQGAVGQYLRVNDLTDPEGVALDLTTGVSSIKLRYWPMGDPGTVTERTMSVVPATTNDVQVALVSGDTSTAEDRHFQIEITYSGGTILPVPTDGFWWWRVVGSPQ
jgi:hypothetical protein